MYFVTGILGDNKVILNESPNFHKDANWCEAAKKDGLNMNNITTPYYRSFLRGIHRWPVDSPHKGPV